MTVHVRVLYTLAPQWSAQEWVDGNLDLNTALKATQKILEGTVSDKVWGAIKDDIPWTKLEDGIYQMRTALLHVTNCIDGNITIKENSRKFGVDLELNIVDQEKPWVAKKVYEDVTDLLLTVWKQTRDSFALPTKTMCLSVNLETHFKGLWHQRNFEDLDVVVKRIAKDVAKSMAEYHAHVDKLYWSVESSTGQSYGAPFCWDGSKSLMTEALRCVYYVLQSYHFISESTNIPWINTLPELSENIDLMFLQQRAFQLASYQHKVFKESYPGEPLLTEEFMDNVKKYSKHVKGCDIEPFVEKMIYNAAILVDYSQRIRANKKIDWSASSISLVLSNDKIRGGFLKNIPASYLTHPTPLADVVTFWENGHFRALSEENDSVVENAVSLLTYYSTWFEAQSKGCGGRSLVAYKMNDLDLLRQDMAGTDNEKRFETYYKAMCVRSPERFYVSAPRSHELNGLLQKFPNFSKVTQTIQKYFKLLHLQDTPVMKMPSILLVGNPGLGKTRYLNALVRILNVPIHDIAMSSMTAGFVLGGLDLSWKGGKIGLIANAFIGDVYANPVFVLDELDKVSGHDHYDPYGCLYQLLEKHTARKFKDEVMQIELDTSGASWFATANSIGNIPEAILSRFQVIYISDVSNEYEHRLAQSVYEEICGSEEWGVHFESCLSDQALEQMRGLDPRAMGVAIFNACANAASRSERPFQLCTADFENEFESMSQSNMRFV